MIDEITRTLKWWIQHANELEKKADFFSSVAEQFWIQHGDCDCAGCQLYQKAIKRD
jgi:hypothetical protein